MGIQVSVFVATSLDGFIARKDGSFDWIDNAGAPDGEDFGYEAFFASIDMLAIGRNTYDQVLTFDKWPYRKKRVHVLSNRAVPIPASLASTVSASAETPGELVERLSAEGIKHVYVDGGVTIQGFLAAGLVDDLTITLIPLLLGAGRPLFGPLEKDVALAHIATKTYDGCGFVQVIYRVVKSA